LYPFWLKLGESTQSGGEYCKSAYWKVLI
jgi:hypothetical protein